MSSSRLLALAAAAALVACGMSPKEMKRAIHPAAEAGDSALVAKILKELPALAREHRSEDGRTPLHLTASESIAKLLLDAGADPNAGDQKGNTPLHLTDKAEIAKLLLERGAKVDARNLSGATPLHTMREAAVAELLLAKGAERDARDSGNLSPIQKTPSGAVARLLASRGASLAADPPADYRGEASFYSPLVLAIRDRRPDTAAALLELGAELPTDLKFVDLLADAVESGHRGLVEQLIARGLDVNRASGLGVTPLHEAARRDHVDIAEVLLKAGADVNAKLAQGVVLNAVVQHRGANPGQVSFGMESKSISGATPLKLAGSDAMKALLRKHGAAE